MRILITGGAGMLSRALLAELPTRGHEVVALDRRGLDITDPAAVGETIAALRPDVVIQGAAYTDVDGSEAREDYARLVNADATRTAARACKLVGARLVYPSTDYVFDGSARRPYLPGDQARPINAYGRTKLLGERAALEFDDALVVRVAWLYGPEKRSFIRTMIEKARAIDAGEPGGLRVVSDQTGAPTWTRDAASMIAGLLERRVPAGIYHATGVGAVRRDDLAREALRLAGLGHVPVESVGFGDFPSPATRPAFTVLDMQATQAILGPLPPWNDRLAQAILEGAF